MNKRYFHPWILGKGKNAEKIYIADFFDNYNDDKSDVYGLIETLSSKEQSLQQLNISTNPIYLM